MAIFSDNEELNNRLDWRILQNGWTSVYLKDEILKEDLSWFSKENFRVVEFDCTTWISDDVMHKELSTKLEFPDYYGKNFSALNDCLWSLEILQDSGLVIVFNGLDEMDQDHAHVLLDIFAWNARHHMLLGNKLITLVKVEDPQYEIQPVGACPVMWNPREWLDSDRITDTGQEI